MYEDASVRAMQPAKEGKVRYRGLEVANRSEELGVELELPTPDLLVQLHPALAAVAILASRIG